MTVSAKNRPEQVRQDAPPKTQLNYSMTSSARASNVGGTVRPSAFATLRLIASSNFVGACTGRSAGLAPPLAGKGKRPYGSRVAAIKEIGVLSGVRVERSERGMPGEFDWVEKLSADELEALADGRLDIESYRSEARH
jgi:hypothetical protein